MVAEIYEYDDEFLAKRNYAEYDIPKYDKESIKEIRKKIAKNNYDDKHQVEVHQEFLNNLANKINKRLNNEKKIGKMNWEIEKYLAEIKRLYMKLDKIGDEIKK